MPVVEQNKYKNLVDMGVSPVKARIALISSYDDAKAEFWKATGSAGYERQNKAFLEEASLAWLNYCTKAQETQKLFMTVTESWNEDKKDSTKDSVLTEIYHKWRQLSKEEISNAASYKEAKEAYDNAPVVTILGKQILFTERRYDDINHAYCYFRGYNYERGVVPSFLEALRTSKTGIPSEHMQTLKPAYTMNGTRYFPYSNEDVMLIPSPEKLEALFKLLDFCDSSYQVKKLTYETKTWGFKRPEEKILKKWQKIFQNETKPLSMDYYDFVNIWRKAPVKIRSGNWHREKKNPDTIIPSPEREIALTNLLVHCDSNRRYLNVYEEVPNNSPEKTIIFDQWKQFVKGQIEKASTNTEIKAAFYNVVKEISESFLTDKRVVKKMASLV